MDAETASVIKEDNELKPDTTYMEIPDSLLQYLTTGNYNVQNICRICLSTNSDVLYSLVSSEENSFLADMFMSLTTIRLLPEDSLPSNICDVCHSLVMQYYEFKIKCENSDCILRSILRGEIIIKDEHPGNSITLKEEINSDNNVKEELEFIEDVQYLEDLSDDADDPDRPLYILDSEKRTNNQTKEVSVESDINVNKSETFLTRYSSKEKTKEKKRTYTCAYCTKVFNKSEAYHVHIKKEHKLEHKARTHPCKQCKESFDSEHDLNVHSALHTKGDLWKCNQCNKEYNNKSTLRRHLQRHMHSKPHVCDSCPKAFTELYALRRHLRVHTGEIIEKKYKCQICDKRYSGLGLLSAHARSHVGSRPCACASCGKRFPSPRLLASHARTHSEHKPYPCHHCDKRFRHESTRNTHHRTHTGEKPYVCSTCGKSFIQNSNLTLHMRTHTGERPYSCSMCERKFTSGSSLKSHQRIHTGERPYSCTICGKRFARMNLAAHMRQHTGERPFACSVCPKKFMTASRLREHCRVHTGEKPYECAYCTVNFATKSHLIKHMKKVHDPPKKAAKREIIVRQVTSEAPIVAENEYNQIKDEISTAENLANKTNNVKEITLEMPLEVTGELILQDVSNMKTELLVVDNSQNNYQINNDNICLDAGNVNIIDGEVNYGNDVNLVTVNEGGMSISTSTLEGTTVKLYQLDQSLVQIHSSSGQVTISKITSKMTTNF